MLCHILVDGVEQGIHVAGALGIPRQFELSGRIYGHQDYSGQDGYDAYDHEHFYQGKASFGPETVATSRRYLFYRGVNTLYDIGRSLGGFFDDFHGR